MTQPDPEDPARDWGVFALLPPVQGGGPGKAEGPLGGSACTILELMIGQKAEGRYVFTAFTYHPESTRSGWIQNPFRAPLYMYTGFQEIQFQQAERSSRWDPTDQSPLLKGTPGGLRN